MQDLQKKIEKKIIERVDKTDIDRLIDEINRVYRLISNTTSRIERQNKFIIKLLKKVGE